ncbi:hypothetical protein BU25DRAFT_458830 [Macroventuria anomochaeta]|uniref:Uncharacterized protein n=1 Tax=Macroventuria anomochaeta TaxID=301207 RepID=A0ACB6RZ05_9PLEO|nr:uncharacterized protein BU25DRAFT_458830 [Macroventuria anomochaeta]KAF2627003.1 hypothetical protein BU25DRAFT_458830 [Macroventuria anomochaeta]
MSGANDSPDKIRRQGTVRLARAHWSGCTTSTEDMGVVYGYSAWQSTRDECQASGAPDVNRDDETAPSIPLYREAETASALRRAQYEFVSSVDKERASQQWAARAWCMACNASICNGRERDSCLASLEPAVVGSAYPGLFRDPRLRLRHCATPRLEM